MKNKDWLMCAALLAKDFMPLQRKAEPTPVQKIQNGDRNKVCQICGHKNKKCVCDKKGK